MQVTRSAISEAVAGGILGDQHARSLWNFRTQRERETPAFRPADILYYLGGLVAIGAMTLFMTLGGERFGGGGLMLISSIYCVVALGLAEFLLARRDLAIPAGIAATLAVVMVPLAVYGVQHFLGLWPSDGARAWAYRDYHTHIDWRWLMMLATLAAGVVALWRYRLPFLVMPSAVMLWYMSMDLAPFLFGGDSTAFFSDRGKLVSMYFGLAMTVLALRADARSRNSKDFAFWLYGFTVLTFWGGLSSMRAHDELNGFLYCCVNLLMIAIGAALSRGIFAVFGGLGVALYLGHLSHTIFKGSMLFPVALAAIGLAIIAVGVYWQRHEEAIGHRLRTLIPARVRELIAHRAE